MKHNSKHYGRHGLPSLSVIVFSGVLAVHGAIHLIGLSYPNAPLWFATALLFFAAGAGVFYRARWWFAFVITGFFFSLYLVLSSWSSAKAGLLINIFVVGYAIWLNASHRFERQWLKLTGRLLSGLPYSRQFIVTEEAVNKLPLPVKKWLMISGVIGKEAAYLVHVKQKGEIRLRPGGQRLSFRAHQYSLPQLQSFAWYVRVFKGPLVWLRGRDFLINGEAGMLIKALGLAQVVNERSNEQLVQGSMTRFLGELAWCPSAALNPDITWRQIDATTAEAVLVFGKQRVSGMFYFLPTGHLHAFSTIRYYSSGKHGKLEHWKIEMSKYKEFHGIRIPTHFTVTWKLPQGDYTWLEFELEKISFNKPYVVNPEYNKGFSITPLEDNSKERIPLPPS